MTFEQLNYFLEVVKDMNFTKAANRLFISQSTLSRHIASLEKSLDTELLARDTHSVRLTEAGVLLAHEGRELLKRKQEIEDSILELNERLNERINLIMSPIQDTRIYYLCNQFQMLYPNIILNLSMLTYSNANIVTEIIDGSKDIGISTSCEIEAVSSGIEWIPLWKDKYYLIVPNDHPLAAYDTVTAEDVEGERILIANDPPLCSALCASVHGYLNGDSHRNRNVMQPKNLTEMTMQVMAGIGLAILPGIYCRNDSGYKALPISGIPTEFDVIMLWKQGQHNPKVEKLKNFIISNFNRNPNEIKS